MSHRVSSDGPGAEDTVALKIFTQPTNDDALARFKQEVLLARQLIHRNVVRVYDLGTALGARFLTMELLVGERFTHDDGRAA